MCDDSFDFEELETLTAQPTVTAWSAQVASRPKSVRIYGRRGSTGALPRSSHSRPAMRFKTSRIEQQLDCLSPTDEEKEFGQISDIENRNLPVFRPDVPKVPGRRRFTRANSMGAGSSGQKSDHIIRRSASVTHSNDFSSATSTKSSSVSSNMDMFSETGAENIHPNWVPLDEHISPKRLACPLEMRGRKKVRSAKNLTSMDQPQATSHAASCSFSNIAREESLTWAKPVIQQTEGVSFPSTHSFNELEFLEASSPAMSSVCSNRKRGICESPFDDIDDCQSVGSLSISRVSTCRSRLLSPPSSYEKAEFHLDMNDKLNKFIQNKDKHMKKSPLMDITSDEGESGVDSSEGMDSDDEVSLDGNTNRRSPVPTFVPFNERQKKRSSVPIFPDTTRRVKVLQPATASVDDIIHSMASYQDLKYLVKSLRGQREGSVCWHVALPNVWGETQRRGFMLWITNDLGFTHRKAGAQASYFQIPKSKGVVILKLLEVSIKVCKDQGIGTTSPINVSPATSHFIFGASAHQKALQGADKTNDNNMASITTTGMIFPEATTHLDSDLMKALVSFGMDDKATHIPTVFAGKPSIMVEDTYETSMRDPRHSMENPSSSRDLMAHMNGLTPNPTRPPRLSTESVSTQGTISKFNIASPYPQPSLCSIGSHLKCFTNEFLETPMMKPAGWGSCPIDGRDWGTSEGCHELISHSLLGMLEWACHEAGVSGSESGLLIAEPRPFALQLELEAANEYRIQDSSPESASERGGSEEIFCNQDLHPESSPSSRGEFEVVERPFEFQFDQFASNTRAYRRRQTEFEKRKRMSIFACAVNPTASIFTTRKSLFVRPSLAYEFDHRTSILNKNLVSEHRFEGCVQLSVRKEVPAVDSFVLLEDIVFLKHIFLFLSEPELLQSAFLVCTKWADAATQAHAELMLMSVGCNNVIPLESDGNRSCLHKDTHVLLDKPWDYLTLTYPWARFLSEGGFKQVYKVFNRKFRALEAISVMDIDALRASGEMNVVGAELAVSVMLSSLVRRGVCPNFVVTRGAFSSVFQPPANIWGSENNKCPKGDVYQSPKIKRKPREPKEQGRYQYIRMELCENGDAEEFIKTLPDEILHPEVARKLLFQMAFALHTAADRFSLKHYDVKLLNYFIQPMQSEKRGDIILRYGLGDLVFALRSPPESAFLAKLADYGTANVDSATNGQQVTIAQFTTLENTPIDFMILGDHACQGHGHDYFGLGLCMLHLFTGHAPYEEILEKVTCPPVLKERLRILWECEDEEQYSVIRGVILSNVDKDEEGHILEGEPNEVLYDTLYRFLVLFGLPDLPPSLRGSKVWNAVKQCLEGPQAPRNRGRKGKKICDVDQYILDCRKYSIDHGNDKYIKRARLALESMDGGMQLLKSLISFDPSTRYTALDVMNSKFMEPLRESSEGHLQYSLDDDLRTFTFFSTNY